jgi:hypothetical protein
MSVILVLDLGHVNWGAVRYKDEVYDWILQAKTGLDNTLGKDRELFRVGSFEFGMGPNIEMVMGYETVGGYTPFFLHRYYEYINFYADGHLPEAWVYFFYGRHPGTRLMDLLNLKYEILYDQGSYAIRNTCLPRAFLVPHHELIERSKVLNRRFSRLDAMTTVLFEKDELLGLARSSPGQPSGLCAVCLSPGCLVIETDAPHSISLPERSSLGGVFVDGQDKDLERQLLFRVLEIPAGCHHVILEFDPWTIEQEQE